jgi:hypothetical protein
LPQLELRADTRGEDSRAHDSRRCTVNRDGSFIIRGLRPGPVQLSLDFEETSRYFSIVRIEYPDDPGGMVSILPASMTRSPRLPAFSPPPTPHDLPPLPPSAPTLSSELHPLPAAVPAHDLPLLPPSPQTLSRQSHRSPPAPRDELPTRAAITQKLLPVGLSGSPPPPTLATPSETLNFFARAVPVAAPSESFSPRFPGDLPPLRLTASGLSGIRLVLSYRNGSIRGHVTFEQKYVDSDLPQQAGISHQSERSSWSTSIDIDPNGDFFIDGLAPGEYEISILSESKTIVVDEDSESRISFAII